MPRPDAALQPLQVSAGVQPSTDKTALSTVHWTYSDKIRFRNGFPMKIGGYTAVSYAYGYTFGGTPRSVYSSVINNAPVTMIGTNSHVYALDGSYLTNVTPTQANTISLANSFAVDFHNLTNPIRTVTGTKLITVIDPNAPMYEAGDTINLAVPYEVGGIPATALSGQRLIQTVSTNSYTVVADTAALFTLSGGGVVSVSSGYITIGASNSLANGDRITIAGATSMNGLTADQINGDHIVRNVTTSSFSILTTGFATSASYLSFGSIVFSGIKFTTSTQATATYQLPIASGAVNESLGQGYGCGLYGMGLYGTALPSSQARTYPRIWFFDKFGEKIVMTPGNQGSVYIWDGNDATGPQLVANAPTAINYAFVSNNILVTLGASGVGNHIFASDQANITNWTASSTNQVYEDYVYGAGTFVSHVPAMNVNLLFTSNQTYIFAYLGLPFVWKVQPLDLSIGIIAPMARCQVNGTAYWMGQQNFYMWSGGTIQIIPADSQITSTIFRYVFANMTSSQRSKIFCWYNRQFDEIWWHYPSQGSNECDRVARLNVSELTWCPDTFNRSAAEYPDNNYVLPRLIDASGNLYAHENGTDANGSAMPFTLTSNLRTGSRDTTFVSAFVPDSVQEGNITVTIDSFRYPQSQTPMYSNTYTVTPSTEWVETQLNGRYWQYTISGDTLGQSWIMGKWQEFVSGSSPQ